MLWIGLSVFAGISILGFGWIIGVYNTLVTARNDYKGQWADIWTEYQRRIDLIFNLVETVKGHANFEQKTITELAKARSGLEDMKTSRKANVQQVEKIESMFAGFKLQLEAYPNLHSHTHFAQLMSELTVTEERILIARAEINNIAEDFNTYIGMFPTVLIAKGLFKEKELEYFNVSEEVKKPDNSPKVKF